MSVPWFPIHHFRMRFQGMHMQALGAALAFKMIVASRVVVGLGEGVALPSMNNLVATLPKSLRSTGLGVAFTGFHSGSFPLQNC